MLHWRLKKNFIYSTILLSQIILPSSNKGLILAISYFSRFFEPEGSLHFHNCSVGNLQISLSLIIPAPKPPINQQPIPNKPVTNPQQLPLKSNQPFEKSFDLLSKSGKLPIINVIGDSKPV